MRSAVSSTLLLLLLAGTPAKASPEAPDSTEVGTAPERMKLGEKDWRARTEGLDYTESYKSRERPEQNEDETAVAPSAPRLDSLKYLYYALILGGLVFLVWRLVRSGDSNAKIRREDEAEIETLEDAEERVLEVDLNALLRNAIAAGDYRMALRVNFLIIIRLLSEKGKITWSREKTNWQYHGEIQERLLADRFREIVISFERSWYGEKPLDQRRYEDSITGYSAMQEQLSA